MVVKTGADQPKPIEPHPTLTQYYEDQTKRSAFVRGLFDRTARHYDHINRILSLGSGTWYRRRCLIRAGLRPGMQVLDVATGTGLMARQAARVAGSSNVVGLDVSSGMLAEARRTLSVELIQGIIERLPVADASFDFLSMGYGLRHVANLEEIFREFHRVLRPGGTLLVLEISRPVTPLRQRIMSLYLGRVIPLLSRLTTGTKEAQTLMRYYWDTIEHCVPAETIVQAIANAGFAENDCHVEFGIFRTYQSRKA